MHCCLCCSLFDVGDVDVVVVVVVSCGCCCCNCCGCCYLPVSPHSCPNDRCLRSESCSTGAFTVTGENEKEKKKKDRSHIQWVNLLCATVMLAVYTHSKHSSTHSHSSRSNNKHELDVTFNLTYFTSHTLTKRAEQRYKVKGVVGLLLAVSSLATWKKRRVRKKDSHFFTYKHIAN